MNRTYCTDNDFGPIVHNCRDDFDFTLLFENTILSIVPSILVLLLAAGRIVYLYGRPKLLWETKFQAVKVTALAFFAILQIVLCALWALQPGLRSWSSILATSLSLLNAFVFCLLSYLEHSRNPRPSTTLIVYLLASTILDIARDRTLWLLAPGSSLTGLFTASMGFKTLVLVLESAEKAKYLPDYVKNRPEETSSILNKGVFYWLNQLMLRGSRNMLLPEDLYELQQNMTAEQLRASFVSHWQQTDKSSKYSALIATAKALKWRMISVIFPRVVLLALTICQPILIEELLNYLSKPVEATSKNIGYGLIGAYGLVYTGAAFATGFYWYLHFGFLVMVRGCLVTAIGWQTARLNIQAIKDPKSAVTLMSTDVERIMDGLTPLHEFWASIVQVGIGLYLLQRQMGVAAIVPIALSILASLGTAWIGKAANKRQVTWMEAVQSRISLTSAMLSSLKGVKLRGLMDVLGKTVQNSRRIEVDKGNGWRSLLIGTVTISFVPEYLSPVTTFLVYILQARAKNEVFDATRAFTTLSLLVIMTQPMNQLIQSIPKISSAVGSFGRIGEFLAAEEQKDFRDVEHDDKYAHTPPGSSELERDGVELLTIMPKSAPNRPSKGQPIFRISDGCFGWAQGEDILKDINVTIPSGGLTCVIGPVASGKSTFCKALLGETRASKGQVELLASKEIAFCDQTAHIISGTIKANIVGFSKPDDKWYETVVEACALSEDISVLPKKHDTVVGSNGINLSGGQRQKVAIARALFARKAILLLDDVFSGFDAGSEQHVFRHVVGPDGLAQKQGMTVIFATHAIKFLPYTDHVIALGTNGTIVQQGSYHNLRTQPGYIKNLAVETGRHGQDLPTTKVSSEEETTKPVDAIAEQDIARRLGDFKIYRYYFGAAGFWSVLLTLIYVIMSSFCFNFPVYWLKVWTNALARPHHYGNGVYLGVYAILQCGALLFLLLCCRNYLIVVVKKTGIEFHRRLLETVSNASLHFLSTTDNGTITNRFSQDIGLVDMQLPLGVLGLMFSVSLCTGQIILIISSSPWVGLTFPVIFAVFYVVQNFYLRTSRQLRFLDLEAKSPLYTNFLETLSGLSTIRAFGWTSDNLALNHKLLDLSQQPNYLLFMIQRWLTFVLDMIVAVLAVLIAALAVVQGTNGGLAGVALTQVMLVNLTIRGIVLAWVEVETSIGAVTRLKTFSDTTPNEHKPLEVEQPPVDWPQNGSIELEALTAIYETAPDMPALNKLNFTVKAGEKLGVCGRSGSGKSSLILALFRMLEIDSGSLKIDGLDLQRLPRNIVRERLNVIPQEPLFLPGTVRENLDPRNESKDADLIRALEKVQLWNVIETRGGLDGEMQSNLLSHGQRQMFCLATAILRKSKIVVLDEATSNVDHETDAMMQRIIREEFDGCTIIAVAHRLDTIIDFDRVAVLDHGVLCELDIPEALLSRDSRFKKMWGERKTDEDT